MTARLTRRRRQDILEAAALVIAERGLCETRVADIAERAGVSAALVLYYFGSKDRLLGDALSYTEDRFYLDTFHELASVEAAPERLIRLIDLAFPAADRRAESDWVLWFELWSRALRDPEVARRREALDRRWRDTIAGVVREGQRFGQFADVDADAFAQRLASLIDGLAIQIMLDDPACSPERGRSICLQLAARELEFDPAIAQRAYPDGLERAAATGSTTERRS